MVFQIETFHDFLTENFSMEELSKNGIQIIKIQCRVTECLDCTTH